MIKTIKSMKNVKVLSNKEVMSIRGGGGGPRACSETVSCPEPYCCNLLTKVCEIGGPYGGCWNP